jgi:aldose 1-epimerase
MIARSPFRFSAVLAAALLLALPHTSRAAASLDKAPFGTVDGKQIDIYTLTNANGVVAKIMNYGAILTELDVPDRNGKLDDVVLGFDNLAGYLQKEPYFGAIVGRVGNRIAAGRFTLNGKTYKLATNDGKNHLHGGLKGFDKVVWDAKIASDANGPAVEFSYLSKDGEEGYPGNCSVKVVYGLTNSNELTINYTVTTDQDTPVNVTNHSYFNLGGPENGGILDHVIMIDADRYTPVDSGLIPTGELKTVAGTPMDFRQATRIGEHIKDVGGKPVGYDHNYVINGGGGTLAPVATVTEPKSGRVMDVMSTEPGVQFYSGNFLDGTLTGKKGVVYNQYWGLALETQHFPDSPNQPNFPTDILKAGQTCHSETVYKFSAK